MGQDRWDDHTTLTVSGGGEMYKPGDFMEVANLKGVKGGVYVVTSSTSTTITMRNATRMERLKSWAKHVVLPWVRYQVTEVVLPEVRRRLQKALGQPEDKR